MRHSIKALGSNKTAKATYRQNTYVNMMRVRLCHKISSVSSQTFLFYLWWRKQCGLLQTPHIITISVPNISAQHLRTLIPTSSTWVVYYKLTAIWTTRKKRQLAVFGDLLRKQLWQLLEERYYVSVLGVWPATKQPYNALNCERWYATSYLRQLLWLVTP